MWPNANKEYGYEFLFPHFIDDFSRMCWIFFLKIKDQDFSCFMEFNNNMENQSGYYIKCLRTDRGGEYISNEFTKFCQDYGIKMQLTTNVTPQQNGVCERKNRTIVNMARSMLHSQYLNYMFWANACRTSVYILNRIPTKSLKGITPYEAWYARKPNVGHFKVFGCLAYAHIPDEKRRKLDPKSQACIFVGYSENYKAYRLYNPKTKSIVISRNVIFDEGGKYGGHPKLIFDDESTNGDSYNEPNNAHVKPKNGQGQVSPPSSCTTSTSSPLNPLIQAKENVKKWKRILANHPTSNILDTNFTKRLTRSQAQEMDNVLSRHENLNMYGDDENVDHSGDIVNYALMANIDVEPSCFENACTNDLWLKEMEEEIEVI